ncbi:MAG: hypothetical protein SGILL_000572 [Bacillariaceae sp.]
MSTYLKTAAMSLLSKTLQTFLSKYLSDVDVEGVALPSVYDGSGWGVRLSNVKLREGVELMHEMPGTVTKRRKKRKRKIRKKQSKTEALKSELFAPPVVESHNDQQGATATTSVESGEDEILDQVDATYTTEPLKDGVYASEEEGYDSNDDIADGKPSRPNTPVQESKGMFSCFYNSRGKNDKTISDNSLHPNETKVTLTKRNSEPEQTISETSSSVVAGNIGNEMDGFIADAHSAPRRQMSVPVTSRETSKSRKAMEKAPVPHPPMVEDVDDDQSRDYEDDDCYEYEEEEYEEDCEVPVRLCLGENGHIGMLDVRLIGKELHVMVEDAVVTIEAIPVLVEEEAEEPDSDDGQDDAIKESQSSDTNAASESGPDASKASGKRKSEPKRDTVGERVLADNPLARLVSAIPHLFLRDVRVRIIIRDELMTVPASSEADATSATGVDAEVGTKPVSSPKDIMVEVGIDFFSVTSGEDILSHFQQDQGTEDEPHSVPLDASTRETLAALSERSNTPPTLLRIPSYSAGAGETVGHRNEYLVRHIRTGRGPSAGVFLRVFAPTTTLPAILSRASSNKMADVQGESILWARQRWITSTENYFLQCSGLDIQARIHMGTRQADGAGYSWFGEYAEEEDLSEYDSMLLLAGMDTIAPGPQLPLPPMEPKMSRGNTPGRKSTALDEATVQTELENTVQGSLHPGTDVYETDKNGIQSCKVPSTLHRVSRGMVPGTCKSCKHLPSEVCALCWESFDSAVKKSSSLDSSIPMPGLVLQISIRDPLEVNIDRESLESVGLLKAMFTKPSATTGTAEDCEKTPDQDTRGGTLNAPAPAENGTQGTSSSPGFFSSMFYGNSAEELKEEEPSEAFAAYMQPEKITVMGVFVADVCLRLHVLREDRRDVGLSFAYWEIAVDCLTIDRHALVADEKTYQDVELDIGRLVWDEFRGTEKKNLCSLGLPQLQMNRSRCGSQTSVASMLEDHERTKSPWPSTACALLDIPPPLETLSYKSRERHGLQLRFLTLVTPNDPKSQSRSQIHLQLGFTAVDAPLAVRHDFFRVLDKVMENLVRVRQRDELEPGETHENKKDTEDSPAPPPKALLSYAIQVDGGDIKMPPINTRMPLTRCFGERSSEVGVSFETELEKMSLAYGMIEERSKEKNLSLSQLATLPEVARMHILLCLKDLSPFEKALYVKKEKNSFRRIKALDKGILKMAKQISKRDAKVSKRNPSLTSSNHAKDLSLGSANYRQDVLTEIMKLDDGELSELWSVHQRYQKKLAKRRGDK